MKWTGITLIVIGTLMAVNAMQVINELAASWGPDVRDQLWDFFLPSLFALGLGIFFLVRYWKAR
jgi:energy-converting hydrogenase Eha subunit E